MCDPVSAMYVVGGMMASQMMSKQPDMPVPAAPTPPPQASQAPETQGVKQAQAGSGQAGGAPGVAQTFLTGPGGVDPSMLNLGKSTLLGGKSTLGA